MIASVCIAKGIDTITLNSLYAVYTNNSANVALCEMSDVEIDLALNIAQANDEVKSVIKNFSNSSTTKYINYILPTEWFAAEIPMNGVTSGNGHSSPSNYNRNVYKIIFTRAEIRANQPVTGKKILTTVQKREPIIEVWVDISNQKVVQILEMPEHIMYQGVPVAVY